jgi:hypothetical protein
MIDKAKDIGHAVDAGWAGKITGTAQKTGKDTWHADASYGLAEKYAKDPNVASVHLNRSIDSVLGTKGVSKQRPDVTVVYKDGKTVHICECVSPSQSAEGMTKKLNDMRNKIDARGKKTETKNVERGGDNGEAGLF